MKTLLVINSSGRVTRSITRKLTERFAAAWRAGVPDAVVIHRDVGLNPPSFITEDWIAAAFANSSGQAGEGPLAESDALVDELIRSDAIVIGAPMYNFGAPAALKAYIDQIVRVGRTFAFEPGAEEPYVPLVPSKPVILVTATGGGGYEPGGPLAHLNLLEPHLEGVMGFIGLTEVHHVRVGFEEFQDQRLSRAIAAAESRVDELIAQITARDVTTA